MATILIVDDDEALRTLLRRILQRAGYDVMLAANGREALTNFRRQPADLVITDLFMPQQDGLETIQALRRLDARLPIMAISGGGSAAQFDLLRTASLLGASRILMKPFLIEDVLGLVKELLPPSSTSGPAGNIPPRTDAGAGAG